MAGILVFGAVIGGFWLVHWGAVLFVAISIFTVAPFLTVRAMRSEAAPGYGIAMGVIGAVILAA